MRSTRHSILRIRASGAVLCVGIMAVASLGAQSSPSCAHWNTEEFFKTATVEDVTACLAAGADPDAVSDVLEYRPLHLVARDNENPAVLQTLVAAGADVGATDWGGDTPLHLAAGSNENPAVLQTLVAAGADVGATDLVGNTPLHLAAQSNENPAVLEALLAAGADVLATCNYGWTPLHYASGNQGPAVINAFLSAGADPTARVSKVFPGLTPLHLAAQTNENLAVLKMLIAAGADPMARTERGRTLLHGAAAFNSAAVVEELLADGAAVEVRDEVGITPLYLAAVNEDLAVLEALMARGARVDIRRDNGRTPLHAAAKDNDNPAVLEALLAAGIDPNAVDEAGKTPLHEAVVRLFPANPPVVEALVVGGADLLARDQDGNTPLHHAAAASSFDDDRHAGDAIDVLLDAGADVTMRNAADQTPWDLARENEALRGSDAFWRLNEARFSAPVPDARVAPAGSQPAAAVQTAETVGDPAVNGSTAAIAGRCEIPNYPAPPGGVANLGLSWCPASVTIQRRVFALQAAGAWCAIDSGSSTTAEQLQARHQEIDTACDSLDAMQSPGIPTCQCPAGYRP